ncbi:2'-5' RNA ligase family protein [Planococcus sp. CP5-4]|uniref:2'-5' RNA ligase family protein n=1 Tax=unclassified Planococcus (in: firmicutes) TaxID=2662419 RepID=UPI001C212201|nr:MULTISPECIES: 2'-5' RNA ligase family protein [unclassified Planococcus (in: firmicutes)]MBU9674480.1 2'-5' RNA ligase family protein [Planococcus sp. CP5-4_YE]MBV0910111.1 2'-5' RNA ligase family protein [Planococcus sp. CP5-4_UN]MBW6064682.1 2'-5' RNA ligase family protein [Planococcus sp. CP5-4]
MQYFIGISPPADYTNQVSQFRKQWPDNRIDEIVEPHITLKAQGGLTPDESWLENVRKACEKTNRFRATIGGTAFFGEEILYLQVESQGLKKLHERLVELIEPTDEMIAQYFELDQFIPHLTLAKTSYGLSAQQLKEMAQLASEALDSCWFEVDSIRVYQENGTGVYRKYIDIPVG